jgi:hypothetical protein
MRTLACLLLGLAALTAVGCEISPIVSAPEPPDTLYDDCKRAARDYCEYVVQPRAGDMERCVATHAFECVSKSRAGAGAGVPLRRSG